MNINDKICIKIIGLVNHYHINHEGEGNGNPKKIRGWWRCNPVKERHPHPYHLRGVQPDRFIQRRFIVNDFHNLILLSSEDYSPCVLGA